MKGFKEWLLHPVTQRMKGTTPDELLEDCWQEATRIAGDWHDIVKECEQLLGCPDTAESPLMCNLPNLIRDLKHREENKAKYERDRIVAIIEDKR